MIHQRSKVLVVDDDQVVCDLVCDGLAEEGYDCDVASNADNALTKLRRQNFDVALLDIKLPGMSGIDLLKTMDNCYRMTAIVMITGVNDINTAVETMKLGASDYIVKPFTINKLNASISTILKNRKRYAVYDATLSSGNPDYGKNVKGRSFSEMNAIAYGVDGKVDYFDFHSKIVTEKTVELARWLGLPGNEIEKWAVARNELHSERDRRIKSTLIKLDRNPKA